MFHNEVLNLIKDLLIERALTIATAESNTGGMLSEQLTRLPGSSVYFQGGIIAYANTVKREIVRINPELIQQYGAVSREVANEMARNVRQIFKTDIGIAISGISGPTGGTKEKPIGLTYISLVANDYAKTEKYILKGERETIRQHSAQKALEMLHSYLISL